MNILPMLARLEGALDGLALTKQMVLLPRTQSAGHGATNEINLVVGLNGSPRSQAALDLTLWIAHQTRLATRKQVNVQVVYVMNPGCGLDQMPSDRPKSAKHKGKRGGAALMERSSALIGSKSTMQQRSNSAIAELPQACPSADPFEEADRILWQARHLADEWRGSLKTHLRFGKVAEELKHVVEAEAASLLVLGCESVDHPLVHQLGKKFPCPVLGIPPALQPESSF